MKEETIERITILIIDRIRLTQNLFRNKEEVERLTNSNKDIRERLDKLDKQIGLG